MNPRRALPVLAIALGCFAPAGAGAAPTNDPFTYAFHFASAIVRDAKDMGKAQAAVVWELVESGRLDDAVPLAHRIDGWRRGTAYADLAVALARAGRPGDARALVAKAEAFRPSVAGWQNTRIGAHIASAYGALGDTAKAESLAAALAVDDPQQYASRSAATVAWAIAAGGEYDKAVARLDAIDDTDDLEETWWRTAALVDMSGQASLSREQRVSALARARKTAASIPGWKRAEALESIANAYRRLGMIAEGREAVGAGEAILVALPDTMPVKAALLSSCARAWAELGDRPAAAKLLAGMDALATSVQPIERPAVYANAAASWSAAGDRKNAERLYAKALDEASTLVNARPRALAIVDVCLSMGRSGTRPTAETRRRLDTLYSGLKDPW